jgi:diguanylate cyclase (GGDEF)-like protein
MARDRDDELSERRARSAPPHAAEGAEALGSNSPEADAAAQVAQNASPPDILDLRAVDRDSAAFARDQAAQARESAHAVQTDAAKFAVDRLFAARDRVAAALDREEAALDRHRAAEYLRRTYRDELTGTLQREAGRDQLRHEVDRAHRSDDPLVIAFLDVVGMKGVNDEQGHASGDALLQAVGSTLLAGLRSYDLVVRYGGDEFVCALPKTQLADAERRFERVLDLLGGASVGAQLSIGLAQLAPEESLDKVISRADKDLYARRKAPPVIRLAGNAHRPSRSG